MIAARPRRARAALSWEESHDAQFVCAVYGKDAQPGVQGDFTVRLLVPLIPERELWLDDDYHPIPPSSQTVYTDGSGGVL